MSPLHRRTASTAFVLSLPFALTLTTTGGCLVEGDGVYERAEAPASGGEGGAGPGGAGGSAGTGGDGGTGGSGGQAGPTFAEVEPILIAKCGACHGATPLPSTPTLVAYEDARAQAVRIVIRTTEGGGMPPVGSPPCTADEIATLAAWQAAGAPPAAEAPPAEGTWADVEPIFVERCGPCHGAMPSRGAPFPLTDYASAAAHAERCAIRAEEGSMPPPGQGVEPCTADEIRRLRLWADADAPE